MENNSDTALREQLVRQLTGGQAYLTVEEIVDKISIDELGIRPEGLPYSFYEQFFHLRVAQYDILDFSRNPDYEAQAWPEDYWPVDQAPDSEEEWEELKSGFFRERQEMMDYILNEENDLYEPVASGDHRNLLREALLVLEHNSYHIGQLAVILRLLNDLD